MKKRRLGMFVDGGTNTAAVIMPYEVNPPILFRRTFRAGIFKELGARAIAIDQFLQEVIDEWKPRGLVHVGFEAPYTPTGKSAGSARFPIGIALKIEEVATRNQLTSSEVVTSTIKKVVAGHGKAEKPDVMSALFDLGYTLGSDHEGDAVGAGLVCIGNWLRGQ